MEKMLHQIGDRARLRIKPLLTFLAVVSIVGGCKQDKSVTTAALQPSSVDGQIPALLATIGDGEVTLADIRVKAGDELDRLDIQYARAKSAIVENALHETLRERVIDAEAKRTGKMVDELIVTKAGGTLEPSTTEVSTWFRDNHDRVGDRPIDQVRSQIADLLRTEKRKTALMGLERRLNQEANVKVIFEPYRLAFNNENAPAAGDPRAPVEIIEFSDFQCPFCKQFAPSLKQVQHDFGKKIRLVYRQFPLSSIHPFALKAAEASLCANEQGKFWELHDLMFGEQSTLSVTDLKHKAGRLGMNQNQFDSCLDTGKYAEQVQRDIQEGSRVGVSGTPALFINGVELPGGAVSYGTIAAAIGRELLRARDGN